MSNWRLPILVGLLLRVGLILISPDSGMHGGDLGVYHGAANQLASSLDAWTAGGEFGWRAPLFFIYLAIVYLPFSGGAPYWVGQVATSLLFLPTVLLLGKLGSRLGLSPRATLIVVWLRSALPLFVIGDVQVLSEPLFALVMVAFFLSGMGVAEHPERAGRIVIFAILGTAMVLTREAGAVFFILGGAALFPRLWAAGPQALLRAGVWAALAVALVLAPWLYRNHLTYGQALPISATAGFNLHVGNHPDADGQWVLPTAPGHVPPDTLKWATRAWDQWHRDRALSYISENPGQFIRMIPRRLGYLFFPRAARSEIIHLNIFPGIPIWGRYLFVVLSGLSSAVLILAIPVGLRSLPPGYFRNAAFLCTLGLVTSVAATHGIQRFLDPVMHLVLPGFAIFLADPRVQLRIFRGWFVWTTAMVWLAIGTLWAVIVFEKI